MQITDTFTIKPQDETAAADIPAAVRLVRRLYGVVWSDISLDAAELTITYDGQWINRPIITTVLKCLGLTSEVAASSSKQTRRPKYRRTLAGQKTQCRREAHIRDTCNCPALFIGTTK